MAEMVPAFLSLSPELTCAGRRPGIGRDQIQLLTAALQDQLDSGVCLFVDKRCFNPALQEEAHNLDSNVYLP